MREILTAAAVALCSSGLMLLAASTVVAQDTAPKEAPKRTRVIQMPGAGKPEDPAKANPEFKAELLRLMGEDQTIRKRAEALGIMDGLPMPPPFTKEWRERDRANLAHLRELINKFGWPDTSAVGQQAAMSAFLIIQHADPAVQRELLPKMEDAVARDEASGQSLAYLVDRVRMGKGEKQLYGTQIDFDEKGEPAAANLEDPERVDERRAKVGLPPLQQYFDMYRSHMKEAGSDKLAEGDASKINQELHAELMALKKAEMDLSTRLNMAGIAFGEEPPAALKADKDKVEAAGAARVRAMIEKHGWPGYSLVGKDGGQVVFTNFRRTDTEFRAKTLPLIEKAVKAGDFSPKQYAFLVDETRVALGRGQVYGTQVRSAESGKVECEPIESADAVDSRRTEVGLAPLADYLKTLNTHEATAVTEGLQIKRIGG
jgi:uncharacterized protein DUF6624